MIPTAARFKELSVVAEITMKKLAIITTHPIQYNAPLFRLLAERGRIALKVFYTWGQTREGVVYDPGFGKAFQWDIPLLDGYAYAFIENLSKKPGTDRFGGIVNKDLIPAIEAWQPDALLVFGWSFHSHLRALRYFKGKLPILFRGDSTLLDEPAGVHLRKWLRRLFLCWVYSHIDYALYTGSANKEYYLRHGLKPHQLMYAPHAVENDRFAADDMARREKAAAWRQHLGIGENEVVFLFAGKLEPKKDPVLLLQAFRQLNPSAARLVIAGNGKLEQSLKNMASQDPRILFLPFQNQQQMPLLYRLADVYVLPSQGPGETWGLAINEAMACGKAVIVSDKCGGAGDLVVPGMNGFIFPAGHQQALENCLRKCMDLDIVRKMGEQSKEIIQKFSLENVASAIKKGVEVALSGRNTFHEKVSVTYNK